MKCITISILSDDRENYAFKIRQAAKISFLFCSYKKLLQFHKFKRDSIRSYCVKELTFNLHIFLFSGIPLLQDSPTRQQQMYSLPDY